MFSSNRLLMGLMFTALLMSACQPIQALTPEQVLSEKTIPEQIDQRPDAPSYAVHGPFGVGYQSLVSDEGSAQPLAVSIWYPALNPTATTEEFSYDVAIKDATWSPDTPLVAYGNALQDAAFDDANGPYPLVILSHGFSLSATWYSNLAEHYASHGFIVLAPEHTKQFDPTFGDMWKAIIDRPADVKQTLDYAELLTATGSDLAGLIDMAHVAVVGHSYGGYTALAMAGAQVDMAAYQARCAQVPEDDMIAFLFCTPLVSNEADMAERAGLDSIPKGLWPSLGDPRVTAIIPMAGDSYLFDKAGLAAINIPMMAMTGSADTGTPVEWGTKPTYDNVSSEQKALVTLVGAEHMIFSTSCENLPWMSDHPAYGYFCFDPVWDKQRALDLIHHMSTAFLLDTLKSDQAAHEALLPDAVQFPGIEYATTLK